MLKLLPSSLLELGQFFGVLFFMFMLGSLVTIYVFLYLFKKYLKFSSTVYQRYKPTFEPVRLSDILRENLNFTSPLSNQSPESCRALNVLFGFIFKEWRENAKIQRWVMKKINKEIAELLETKAAKRLLRDIKVNTINLGSSSPVIHGVVLREPCAFNSRTLPDKVVMDIDLEYEGGFYLAVDVDLVFGKSATVGIRLNHLRGLLRVQLNRLPCTHWYASFVEEPTLNIKIDTSFQSRPLPQLGSLILNRIHRSLRRKHTLPHYKLRYTPFNAFWIDKKDVIEQAFVQSLASYKVDVVIVACSRLFLPHPSKSERRNRGTCGVVFATLSVDPITCEGLEPIKGENVGSKKSFLSSTMSDALKDLDAPSRSEPDPVDAKGKEESKYTTTTDKIDDDKEKTKPVVSEKLTKQVEAKENVKPEQQQGRQQQGQPSELVKGDKVTSNDSKTTYMMVTRNFNARLSEKTIQQQAGGDKTIVYVVSITWHNSGHFKASIHEGDRILSINGREIETLSQAIAVINETRSKRARFYIKVQRNRRARLPSFKKAAKEKREDDNRTAILPEFPPPFDSPPASDEETKSEDGEETESDFTDIDSDDYELYKVEEEMRRKTRSLTAAVGSTKSSPTNRNKSQILLTDVPSTSHQTIGNTIINTTEDLKFAQLTTSSTATIVQTSLCNAEQTEYSWEKETYSLKIAQNDAFLNVRFWFQEVNTLNHTKQDAPALVGSVSVPLHNLDYHCKFFSSKRFTRRYKITSPLAPGQLRTNIENSFKQRSGFKLKNCYGDATITVKVSL